MNRRTVIQGLAGVVSLTRVLNAADSPTRIDVGGSTLDVSIDNGSFDVGTAGLMNWVTWSAQAVTAYFGKFPVPHARIQIVMAPDRRRIGGGVSFGDGGAHCRISVGQHVSAADLNDDWELTHEMVHFAFPSMEENHLWIEEGSATYVEPIARVMIGNMRAEQVWSDMARSMRQGLPQAGDEGLDRTHTWGRTYWGGALYCLRADVAIRTRTRNARGLRDALRAINRAGGSIEVDWPLDKALEIGDKATGGSDLMDLYHQMRAEPDPFDLARLWEQLGVRREGDGVVLDDHAPLAATRIAICSDKNK